MDAQPDSLQHDLRAAVQEFRESIRALVVLVDTAATDSEFNLAQRRIRAARRACEMLRDAMEQQHDPA